MIRPAVVEDAARLAEIHVASWQAAYAGLLSAEFLDGLSDTLERRTEAWQNWIGGADGDRQVLVAVDGAEIVGFAHTGRVSDEDLDPETMAELYAMYLDPAHFRRGWGSRLMDAVFEQFRARGLAGAALWVMAGNAAARAFYERHGWESDGTESDLCLGITIPSVRYRVGL